MLDALVDLFCRSKVSADVRLIGGWLFRQLLPHGEEEFTAFHLRRLKVHSYCLIIPVILMLGFRDIIAVCFLDFFPSKMQGENYDSFPLYYYQISLSEHFSWNQFILVPQQSTVEF